MGGTGGRRTAKGLAFISALTAALPAVTKNLALELAPIRVNLIAAGFVDTPLSAELLGDQLDTRREQLRATLPIRRVVGPADVAALAVDLPSWCFTHELLIGLLELIERNVPETAPIRDLFPPPLAWHGSWSLAGRF
jgi:NAD(P)-dependent dehydrogenase (short-subunit alcohol dehydrogenase family)